MKRYTSIREAKIDLELEVYEFDLKKKKESLYLMIDDLRQLEQLAKRYGWEEVKKKDYLKYYIDHKNQKDYYIYK
jgi:hypothetical protein